MSSEWDHASRTLQLRATEFAGNAAAFADTVDEAIKAARAEIVESDGIVTRLLNEVRAQQAELATLRERVAELESAADDVLDSEVIRDLENMHDEWHDLGFAGNGKRTAGVLAQIETLRLARNAPAVGGRHG